MQKTLPASKRVTLLNAFFHSVENLSRMDLERWPTAASDMLRYDNAFVPKAPGRLIVAFPIFKKPGHGRIGGHVTHRRWHTFGLRLSPQPIDPPEDWTLPLPKHPDDWITFDHPRTEWGGTDYNELRQFTLTEHITELNRG